MKKEREVRHKEDAYWEEAGEGRMTKAQMRKAVKGADREEANAKKQEAREEAERESEELSQSKNRQEKRQFRKVTAHDLLLDKEKRASEQAEAMVAHAEKASRTVKEHEYDRTVMRSNINVLDNGSLSARGIDAAVDALGGMGIAQTPMTFKKFFERELPGIRDDKPGLKLPQYKDIAFKLWLRSPENPSNQGR